MVPLDEANFLFQAAIKQLSMGLQSIGRRYFLNSSSNTGINVFTFFFGHEQSRHN